jgi:hypothetical protein
LRRLRVDAREPCRRLLCQAWSPSSAARRATSEGLICGPLAPRSGFGSSPRMGWTLANRTTRFYYLRGGPWARNRPMKPLIESAFRRFGLDIAKYRASKITKPVDV